MNIDEIKVDVPWGHLAAKAWGDSNNPIVLVFHGVMDNAGSFDRLIPLLPTTFYYICFDLPGHGQSSHFPPFVPYYSLTNIMVYKMIMLHFKQEKYIIIGHSYGAQLGFFFAQVYPEFVEKLVMLDAVHLFPTLPNQFQQSLRSKFDFYIELNEKLKNNKPPTYTYEECWKKMRDQRYHGYITEESARALVKRAIAPADDGKFFFTMDQRIKNFLNPVQDFRYILDTFKKFPVTCPVLMILSRESELQRMFMKPLLNQFKKMRNIRMVRVEGNHDVHNNNPEFVEPHITKFLLWKKGKL